MVVSLYFGGKKHVSNGQHVSFKEPCITYKTISLQATRRGFFPPGLQPVQGLQQLLGFEASGVQFLRSRGGGVGGGFGGGVCAQSRNDSND